MPIINANASAPRRAGRSCIAVTVDVTVTPPYSGAVAGQIQSGELLYRTTNYAAASLSTPGSANANAAFCIGVAQDSYPPLLAAGIYLPPVFGDPMALMVTVFEDGDHMFLCTAGDVYNAYAPIYVGATGRTIQATASGTSVGYISPDQRPTASLPTGGAYVLGATAVAGQMVYIRIQPALGK